MSAPAGCEGARVGCAVFAERRPRSRYGDRHRGGARRRRADGRRPPRGEQLDATSREIESPKKGEAASSGCTAEQTSWWNPGRVSSCGAAPPAGRRPRPRITSTTRPARASVTAAARPLGPEPTTTASTARSASVTARGEPLGRAPHHRHRDCRQNRARRASAESRRRCGRAGGGRARPGGAGPAPERDRVVGGGVPEDGLGGHLLGQRWASWISTIDAARQLERGRVVFAPALGPGPSAVGQWSGM